MRARIATPESVNAMIPLIQQIANDLEVAYARTAEILRACADDGVDLGVAGTLDEMQGYVYEIEKLGGTVRSYEPLRIDFMAEVDGEIGYLCWETGDREAILFHGAMERCGGLALSA